VGEKAQGRDQVRVIRGNACTQEIDRLAQDRLGFLVLVLAIEDHREVAQCRGDVPVSGREEGTARRQGFVQERLGLGELALGHPQRSKSRQALDDAWVPSGAIDVQGFARERIGFGVPAL
jgi:hypothetical protein